MIESYINFVLNASILTVAAIAVGLVAWVVAASVCAVIDALNSDSTQ